MALYVSKLTKRLPKTVSFELRSVLGTRLPFIDLTFTDIRCAASRRSIHSVVRQASDSCPANSLLVKSKLSSYRCAVSTAERLKKFTAGSKAFHSQSASSSNRTSRSRSTVAFSILGVSTGAFAALHTTAMWATSDETINLNSDRTDWQEAKNFLLGASQEGRREHYRVDYLPLDNIPVWTPTDVKPLYKPNDALNKKISLFRGDITKLEIDAVVNAGMFVAFKMTREFAKLWSNLVFSSDQPRLTS
ncbi:hypothetical protein ACEWY4_026898 [Coilia grayii]|uniref:Uncharacterized protein n=1 Tax=Coilia grayii TaxID=363190 RepID=A0ABD1IRZ9_9TELE